MGYHIRVVQEFFPDGREAWFADDDRAVDGRPCTAPSRCVVHSPNRFDPYEALDLIEKIAGDEQTREEGVGTLLTQVHALRAYITGMEHG